ncbi:hypothetical protein T4D_14190 [Trichinella pseudospiralis]|uniref:Uncharacterized protein n=1 Tax=Trichinella pseudospiralis TaxID=6337 RepID=A0A0V1G219_TRIPS|nr:hypothetical protein T4D_14190 [Trichinella pseudospiralis]
MDSKAKLMPLPSLIMDNWKKVLFLKQADNLNCSLSLALTSNANFYYPLRCWEQLRPGPSDTTTVINLQLDNMTDSLCLTIYQRRDPQFTGYSCFGVIFDRHLVRCNYCLPEIAAAAAAAVNVS